MTNSFTNIKNADQKIIPVVISLSLLFILSTVYFYWFGNYLFFFQENQSLFVFGSEYLQKFIRIPGGLLEYTGNFLKQGYFNYAYGSIILSLVFTSVAIVFLKLNRRLSPGGSYSLSYILLPSCFLILMQMNQYHSLHHQLGFLLVAVYFLFSIISDKKWVRFFVLALFPLFFYLVGAFAWIYLGMYIIYSLVYEKGRLRFYYPVLLLIIAYGSFQLFIEVLFFQSVEKILIYPLPIIDLLSHKVFFYLLSGFMVLFPLLVKASLILKIKKEYARIISLSTALVVFSLTIYLLSRLYDPKTANLYQIEKFVFEQDWDAVVEYHETFPSTNMIGQYYYNLALSEKDQLCDRLFFGRQDFGPNSLILPWDSQEATHLNRGAYFFYAIGMINEAHRWAFESMVLQGFRPENIKLLIKTNLINGHYKVAEKYIYVLKRTIHYRNWVKKYEEMVNNPALIKSAPELGKKMIINPDEDYFIALGDPKTNITSVLQVQPHNKRAFEYKMAWLLLNKNVLEVVNEIKLMKDMGYTRIPRHIEEAVFVFANLNQGVRPDLGGLTLSLETEVRFRNYAAAFQLSQVGGRNPEQEMRNVGGNTFWYYLHFK